jgi:DNA repair exonuclease SbcCD nuclease subunit
LSDFRRTFDEAVEKALSLEPGVIVFGGDLLHHTRPDPVSMRAVLQGLLRAAEKTNVVVVIGNHEISGHLGTAYAPLYSDLHENIHVLSTETPHIQLKVKGKTIGFHGFQYLRNREISEKTLRGVLRDAGGSDLEVLCLHQAVEGYLAPHELSSSCLREVASKFDLILLGHAHKHQKVSEVFDICPTYYIGSTERVSFNEWENKTGFMVFEDFDFRKHMFIEVSSASMKRVSADLGAKNPGEINSFIEARLKENRGTELLQVEVKADILGDVLDIRQDWNEQYPDYTILDVNVTPSMREGDVMLERLEVSSDTIKEFFEKKGLSNQSELLSECIKLFEEYGR